MSLSRDEREAYNARLDFFRIEEGAFAARYEKGKAEGKLEIAKNLLSKGLDAKFISETTGLSEEEIAKLVF